MLTIDGDEVVEIDKTAPVVLGDVECFHGSYQEFFRSFLLLNRPCVIPNVIENWLCTKYWIFDGLPNFNYLQTNYGNVAVKVSNCDERYYNSQNKTEMPLSEFLDYWKDYIESGYPMSKPCLYMKDWHFTRDFPDEKMYVVPAYFSSDWLNEYYTSEIDINDDYRFVYMGPKNSWTPFHVDVFTSYSWSVNICGKKKWIIFPPGEENKLKDNLGNIPYDIQMEDLDNLKLQNKINFYVLIQDVGEAVFIPSGWHHQVWNMKDTISINHNWINGCNIENAWLSLESNLQLVKEKISDIKYCDDWNEQCQLLLKSFFGMNYEDFHKFLNHIITERSQRLRKNETLPVYGGWEFGTAHLIFDLKKAKLVLNYLLEDAEKEMLNFSKIV